MARSTSSQLRPGIPLFPNSRLALTLRQLGPHDVTLMEALLTTFGKAFDEVGIYTEARPGEAYPERLLGSDEPATASTPNSGRVRMFCTSISRYRDS